jgi:hypothetical protein
VKPAIATRVINNGPVLQQALRDVADWVERGVAPPARHLFSGGARQRPPQSNTGTPYARIQNLGRARVVVR